MAGAGLESLARSESIDVRRYRKGLCDGTLSVKTENTRIMCRDRYIVGACLVLVLASGL